MPYETVEDLPASFKNLPVGAKRIALETMNAVLDGGEESMERVTQAVQAAWANIKRKYRKVGDKWIAKARARWPWSRPPEPWFRYSRAQGMSDGRWFQFRKMVFRNLDGSYEALLDELRQMVQERFAEFGATEKHEVSVAATFSRSIVVQSMDDETWRADWARDAEGRIILSNIRPVSLSLREKPVSKVASAGAPSVSKFVRFVKADEERRIVWGIALEPGSPETPDAQGDWETAEEIERACHDFLRRYRKAEAAIGFQHEREAMEVELVECYVAPVGFELGGQAVKAGSWVMASYVGDDVIWQGVKSGSISGYSIGGIGERV